MAENGSNGPGHHPQTQKRVILTPLSWVKFSDSQTNLSIMLRAPVHGVFFCVCLQCYSCGNSDEKKGGRDSSESLPKSIDRVPDQQDDFNPIHGNSQQSRAFIIKALPGFLADLRLKGWVIKEYVRRTFNAVSHIPEELKGFEDCFERKGEYLVIYVPRGNYVGEDEKHRGRTRRILPGLFSERKLLRDILSGTYHPHGVT